jgi:antirestriction protein
MTNIDPITGLSEKRYLEVEDAEIDIDVFMQYCLLADEDSETIDLEEVVDRLAEIEKSSVDFDIVASYCDYFGEDPATVDLEKVCDSYSGHARSDEEFAENLADELGLVSSESKWPNNYIDWELAARDLMNDYAEEHGNYFSLNV